MNRLGSLVVPRRGTGKPLFHKAWRGVWRDFGGIAKKRKMWARRQIRPDRADVALQHLKRRMPAYDPRCGPPTPNAGIDRMRIRS
jgi:hypothetical protein